MHKTFFRPVTKSSAKPPRAAQALYEKALDLYFTQDTRVTAQAAWGPRPRTVAELIAQSAL